MRNRVVIALLVGLLFMAAGCRKRRPMEPPVVSAADTALVDIAILLRNIPMERTKAVDTSAIANLNLFFVHQSYPSAGSPEVRHYYFPSVSSQLRVTNIRVGKYRMYAVANYRLGSMAPGNVPPSHNNDPGYGAVDLSSMTEADIIDVPLYPVSDHLLMTAYDEEVQIRKPGVPGQVATQDHIDINLVRQHANVTLNYSIVGNAASAGLKITSVNMVNETTRIRPWAATKYSNFTSDPLASYNPLDNVTSGSVVCYPLANQQGENLSITTETERNSRNAPANSSYLRVATQVSPLENYNYSVYLGANQTTDFNLIENSQTVVNLQINGLGNDPRISTMSLITNTNFPNDPGSAVFTVAGIFTISSTNMFNDEFVIQTSQLGSSADGEWKIWVESTPGSGNYDIELSDISAATDTYHFLAYATTDDPADAERSKTFKAAYTMTNTAWSGTKQEVLTVVVQNKANDRLTYTSSVITFRE